MLLCPYVFHCFRTTIIIQNVCYDLRFIFEVLNYHMFNHFILKTPIPAHLLKKLPTLIPAAAPESTKERLFLENGEVSYYSLSKYSIAKYDSNNKIHIPGYLLDLLSKRDSPRKDYRLGKDRIQMLCK